MSKLYATTDMFGDDYRIMISLEGYGTEWSIVTSSGEESVKALKILDEIAYNWRGTDWDKLHKLCAEKTSNIKSVVF